MPDSLKQRLIDAQKSLPVVNSHIFSKLALKEQVIVKYSQRILAELASLFNDMHLTDDAARAVKLKDFLANNWQVIIQWWPVI